MLQLLQLALQVIRCNYLLPQVGREGLCFGKIGLDRDWCTPCKKGAKLPWITTGKSLFFLFTEENFDLHAALFPFFFFFLRETV